ncbi:PREDICTED: UPF0544 protein C5orf45 homolog [Nelumbo nucifera]|uniref:UPF0544 protein C5orf45 homolog n=2 Tax=Nelumbo nucifera TaxID=4432 RepID=A0A1U8AFB6_NELNU|nr:PREDICTED: UPF0544 protein C5orf45 homolog [Nelumbo nucifera]DAD40152.1 TPA_asm: hypothetical protein HUJ06_014475 [Nelumbo nucifera]
MSTIFIAVQCCQCSTMQVKQQKKSSNKWNCVICNQKQSVWKVFARGYAAKDIRKFVQGFNMSRQFIENRDESLIQTLEEIDDPNSSNSSCSRKRRNDWTEYLDTEDDADAKEELDGNAFEPKIVTELPEEHLKKPKLKKTYPGEFHTIQGSKPLKPVFSNTNTKPKFPHRDDEDEKGKRQLATGRESKWSCYLTEEESDNGILFGREREPLVDLNPWSHAGLENEFNGERVEDEVHPDFT